MRETSVELEETFLAGRYVVNSRAMAWARPLAGEISSFLCLLWRRLQPVCSVVDEPTGCFRGAECPFNEQKRDKAVV